MRRILRKNVLILLGMAAVGMALAPLTNHVSVAFLGIGVLTQVAGNALLGAERLLKRQPDGLALLLSAGVVLLLGAGVWTGVLALGLLR